MKKGFTLVELLIVVGIISALVAMQGFVYVNSQRNARDSRRQTDLENVRAAVEQYRSTNNSYPLSLASNPSCASTSGLTFNPSCAANCSLKDVSSNIYMSPLPSDPKCQNYSYKYSTTPANCTGKAGTGEVVCTDYTLGTYLEGGGTACGGLTCSISGGTSCNYCMGPYGKK